MFKRNVLAYSATAFGSSMISSIFGFYYVRTFLKTYGITEWWFNTAQIIYMVWNAVNDPLFGYLQDSSKFKIFRVRSLAILCGAPLYSLSFLIPWFPMASHRPEWMVGLHLIISLCFYDSLLTFVLLAHCALFTEISPSANNRATLLKYSQVASTLGSSVVFLADYISDSQNNFLNFQILCVFVAVISCVAMCYTGLNVSVSTKYQPASSNDDKETSKDKLQSSWWLLTIQIVTQRNFICFVIVNFLQIFHTTYSGNFFLIFAEELMGAHVPPFVQSMLAGSTFMIPQIIGILANPLIVNYGSYYVILMSFYIKLGMAVMLYMSGPNSIILLAIFFVLDKSIPAATFSQFNMPLSDIIDDDLTKYKRSSPVSSLVFGTNALFTKPAQSFAPMFIVAILSSYGYKSKDMFTKDKDANLAISTQDVKLAMFNIMCFLPAVIAILQILVWRCYGLRGNKGKNTGDDTSQDDH